MKENMVQIPDKPIPFFNYSGGQFIPGTGEKLKIQSPYSNSIIGEARSSTPADIDKIIKDALSAQPKWAEAPLKERAQVLFRLREILIRDIEKISHRVSAECGKTLAEAKAGIMKGVEVIEFATSLPNLDIGGKMEVSRGVFCEYRREPLGIVAGITPFNFPAMVPLWMMPIAIALGNAFVWKPSDKTPLTSLLIAEAWAEAGLPAGILSLVQGGKESVEALLDHPDVAALGFVGSTKVAEAIFRRGSNHLKRVLALGGAKNHILLLPDADSELVAKGIADSFTGCAGQRCMAASVLCTVEPNVEASKKIDQLIQAIVKQAKSIELGKDMGAIISADSLKKLETAISHAEKDGAKILLDGRKPKAPSSYENGNWLGPTVLDQVRPGAQAATEELFGPLLTIIRCKSIEEALRIEESSPYGNAISVFTQNGAAAEEVARRSKVGMVGINIGVPVPREPFSFGGTFSSKFGHGDITGAHSLDFWSNIKKITTKWAPQRDQNWMS
jgi:malonate-semialdehyde dehydrogenase (acetylating)/methylmalonate-semialdehyde dehydrogenase